MPDVEAARLATPAEVIEHQDALGVELAYSSALGCHAAQPLTNSRKASAISGVPVQLPGAGPSATTNSIPGSAHSMELRSPRSQAA
jgi:hypothetical protein